MRYLLREVSLHVRGRRRGREHGGDEADGPGGPGPRDVLVLGREEQGLVEGHGVGEEVGAGKIQGIIDNLDPKMR